MKTHIRLKIGGMSCAACSSAIEKALLKSKGVLSVQVNLVSNYANIDFDSDIINESKITQIIQDTGYFVQSEMKKPTYPIWRIWLNFILSIPLFYITMAPMVGLPPLFIFHSGNPTLYALAQLFLTTPVMIINYSIFIKGFKALYHRSPNMDSLIAIGTATAYIYSSIMLIGILQGSHHLLHQLYFESSAVILTLVVFGKFLEENNKQKTNDAVAKLIDLRPTMVTILKDGFEDKIPISALNIGDVVVIKDGESIPCDGQLITGNGLLNESMLTGESLPIFKEIGDTVYAGTINQQGRFTLETQRLGQETMLGKIITLIETTNESKAPIAKLADRISSIFVPIVLSIALVAWAFWFLYTKDLSFSLTIFVSVLVIACPCALGLATPTAIIAGTGVGAKHGILYKNAEILENTRHIDTIFFDKTGTLTTGDFQVQEIVSNSNNPLQLLDYAYSLEKNSSHPLARSIVAYAESKGRMAQEVESFQSFPGQGIQGIIAGRKIKIGNAQFIGITQSMQASSTILYLSEEEIYLGHIALQDTIKHEAYELMKQLHSKRIDTLLISGDHEPSVAFVAKELGIKTYYAAMLPHQKLEKIDDYQKQGKHVMMVGDGINDSPSLIKADIGVSISEGSDITIEASDIVLLKNNLTDVSRAITIATSTLRTIKQNLFWAFAYNVVGIPIAFGLLYPWTQTLLNPMLAALAMSLSSISVVGNALRLKQIKIK